MLTYLVLSTIILLVLYAINLYQVVADIPGRLKYVSIILLPLCLSANGGLIVLLWNLPK